MIKYIFFDGVIVWLINLKISIIKLNQLVTLKIFYNNKFNKKTTPWNHPWDVFYEFKVLLVFLLINLIVIESNKYIKKATKLKPNI